MIIVLDPRLHDGRVGYELVNIFTRPLIPGLEPLHVDLQQSFEQSGIGLPLHVSVIIPGKAHRRMAIAEMERRFGHLNAFHKSTAGAQDDIISAKIQITDGHGI
ncbi:hypothetical protein D3C80_1512350 [compost metagenome]